VTPEIFSVLCKNEALLKAGFSFKDGKVTAPESFRNPEMTRKLEKTMMYLSWLDSTESEALKNSDEEAYRAKKIDLYSQLDDMDALIE